MPPDSPVARDVVMNAIAVSPTAAVAGRGDNAMAACRTDEVYRVNDRARQGPAEPDSGGLLSPREVLAVPLAPLPYALRLSTTRVGLPAPPGHRAVGGQRDGLQRLSARQAFLGVARPTLIAKEAPSR